MEGCKAQGQHTAIMHRAVPLDMHQHSCEQLQKRADQLCTNLDANLTTHALQVVHALRIVNMSEALQIFSTE